jgi:hypothetical protein
VKINFEAYTVIGKGVKNSEELWFQHSPSSSVPIEDAPNRVSIKLVVCSVHVRVFEESSNFWL